MALQVETPRDDDLETVVELAVRAQRDPDRYLPALSDDAGPIGHEIAQAAGERRWTEVAVVARLDGSVVGWLLADRAVERGRIWWVGPVLDPDLDGPAASEVADALYRSSADLRAGFAEEELAYDARSTTLAELGRRHGFTEEESSLALRCQPEGFRPAEVADRITPVDDRSRAEVAALHDGLFAGTHTTGSELVAPGPDPRWCLWDGDEVVGYVATERQPDGSLYVDYLGVGPDHRGRGFGRALVSQAVAAGFADGATTAHLTVRSGNAAARSLYRSLGFVEERELVPARKGFLLG